MNTEHGYNIWAAFRGAIPIEKVEHLSDVVLEALPYSGGTISANEAGIDLRFPLVSDSDRSLVEVAGAGEQIASRAVEETGLELRLEALQVLTDDELEREVSTPNFPELVGMSEIAEILGVTRQRVNQLRTRDDFPAPVAELKAGSVWARPMLERFIEEWPRTAGRAPSFWVIQHRRVMEPRLSKDSVTLRLSKLEAELAGSERFAEARVHQDSADWAHVVVAVMVREYDEARARDAWFDHADWVIEQSGIGWDHSRPEGTLEVVRASGGAPPIGS